MAKTIYALINTKTHKSYIGICSGHAGDALDNLRRDLANGNGPNKDMQSDWDSQGGKHFVRRVVEEVEDSEASKAMKYHIERTAADQPGSGYNLVEAAPKPKPVVKSVAKKMKKKKKK